MNPDAGGAQWFALRVKSRSEKTVAMMAQNKGFEEFVPLYQSRRRWSDRMKSLELPLFPGYVFCRLNVERRMPLLTIPGVLHFVGIGRTPMPIEDAEIGATAGGAGEQRSDEPTKTPKPEMLALSACGCVEKLVHSVRRSN